MPDPLLEQVGPAGRALLEQPERVVRADVLADHDDADVGMAVPQPRGRLDALVRARRRHPDVRDHDVGLVRLDRAAGANRDPSSTRGPRPPAPRARARCESPRGSGRRPRRRPGGRSRARPVAQTPRTFRLRSRASTGSRPSTVVPSPGADLTPTTRRPRPCDPPCSSGRLPRLEPAVEADAVVGDREGDQRAGLPQAQGRDGVGDRRACRRSGALRDSSSRRQSRNPRRTCRRPRVERDRHGRPARRILEARDSPPSARSGG